MRKNSFKRVMTRINMIFLRNPILIEGLAVATAVMTTTRLLDASAACIALWIMALPTSLIVYPIGDRLPNYAKAILYALIACVMYIPAYFVVRTYSQQAIADLGIYLPLLALSELIMARSEKSSKHRRFAPYILSTVTDLVGFTLIMFVVAFVRELMAYGTLFGVAVNIATTIPVMALPFMGFITVGYLSAFIRWVYSRLMKKVSRKRVRRQSLIINDAEVNV